MTDHETQERIGAMEQKLDDLIACVNKMQTNMATKSDVAEVKSEVAEMKEIAETWRSIKLWAQFGKWAAGFVGTVAAAAVALKAWWLK